MLLRNDCSLTDVVERSAFGKLISTWLVDMSNLTESQKELNKLSHQSTGVYWIPLFQILESYKFEVKLVNARHVKNVPGRKSDVQDCQWLQ